MHSSRLSSAALELTRCLSQIHTITGFLCSWIFTHCCHLDHFLSICCQPVSFTYPRIWACSVFIRWGTPKFPVLHSSVRNYLDYMHCRRHSPFSDPFHWFSLDETEGRVTFLAMPARNIMGRKLPHVRSRMVQCTAKKFPTIYSFLHYLGKLLSHCCINEAMLCALSSWFHMFRMSYLNEF